MKSFQIKDLMVTIDSQQPQPQGAPGCQLGCSVLACSIKHTPQNCFGCTFVISCYVGCSVHVTPVTGCHAGCSVYVTPITCHGCTFIITCPNITAIPTPTITTIHTTPQIHEALPSMDQSELAQLKAQVAGLQEKIDEHMKQSPEDLDLLESKLKEALHEIATQKANLKGK